MYGLKQAPALYRRLTHHLVDTGYKRGEFDRTLFTQHTNSRLLVAQIYVDDIVFALHLKAD